MEIQKVTIDELRNYDLKKLAELEKEVRKEIASIRTSVFFKLRRKLRQEA